MNECKKLTKDEIAQIYSKIKEYYYRYLINYGVKIPKLFNPDKSYTKDALVLIYLTRGYPNTQMTSKTELTQFVRLFYPSVNDVQQARHLGAQKGWYILSGGRDNIVLDVKPGYYQLYSLEQPYPLFHGHRITDTSDWDEIKEQYGYHCATCGSIENKPNIHWPATKTKLQKAHMDPYEPLAAGNIIPQCQKCNRGDRNRWIYDERGRIVQLASASVIRHCRPNVRWEVYKILYQEFNGEKPDGKPTIN